MLLAVIPSARREGCCPMTTWESDDLLHVRVLRSGTDAVIALRGELDFSNAKVLQHSLQTVLDGTPPAVRTVIVDCAELQFLDVAGLAVLLEARNELHTRRGRLLLRRPTPSVQRMIELAAVDRLLEHQSR